MRRIIRVLSMGLLVALAGCTTPHSDIVVPAYVCLLATESIKIDGKLDESTWQQAEVIEIFYPYRPKDAKILSGTKASLAWDKNYLYVAIECKDDDIWSYSEQPDSELWCGDVAEIFIKPSTSMPSYCEFVVAPNGTLSDARYPSRGAGGYFRFKNWSSKAKVATIVNGTDGNWKDTDIGYVVEMAIPFSAFSDIAKHPAEGTAWTFGLFRYDFSKSYENTLLMMSIPESKKSGFHYYEGYSQLIFSSKSN